MFILENCIIHTISPCRISPNVIHTHLRIVGCAYGRLAFNWTAFLVDLLWIWASRINTDTHLTFLFFFFFCCFCYQTKTNRMDNIAVAYKWHSASLGDGEKKNPVKSNEEATTWKKHINQPKSPAKRTECFLKHQTSNKVPLLSKQKKKKIARTQTTFITI